MTPLLVALVEGPNLPLDKPILLVGRHQECDVQIPSRKISRKHCCIAQVADYVVVKDLQSTNGIRVNGEKMPEGVLRHGDELTIGNMKYRLDWPKSAGSKSLQRHAMKAADGVINNAHSTESPIALPEDPRLGPAPTGLPLVLPVGQPEQK